MEISSVGSSKQVLYCQFPHLNTYKWSNRYLGCIRGYFYAFSKRCSWFFGYYKL